jgi:hypothetical protein
MTFESKKVLDLKEDCRIRKIKISGNKDQLIARLNAFEKARVSQSHISIDPLGTTQLINETCLTEIEVPNEILDKEVPNNNNNNNNKENEPKEKRTRSSIIWNLIQTYDSQNDYVLPDCWKYYKPTKAIKGDKEYFECHIDKTCMCILYHTDNDKI